MAKSKSSEIEFLRDINRKLKSENKNLRKRLGHAHKQVQHHIDDNDGELTEDDFAVPEQRVEQEKLYCPKCSGILKVVDLEIRKLFTCECGYRKSIKV